MSELKTDRAFVPDASTDEGDTAIVGSVIALAYSLGLRVTGEGVERGAVARARVRLRGGFHLGRPAPAAEVTHRLLDAAGEGEVATRPEGRRSPVPAARS